MSEASFEWPAGKRLAVSITFDDARPIQADAGLPLLDEYGVKASFYVSMAGLDQRPDVWRAAAAHGHEIGNHTFSHPCTGNFHWSRRPSLESMTLEEMAADIDRATGEIESRLGVTPRTFAFPCGMTFVGRGVEQRSYVPLVAERFIAGRGFRSEYINDPSFCDMAMLGGTEFDCMESGDLDDALESTAANGSWLILAGHNVLDQPGRQTVTPALMRQLCQRAADPSQGIWLDTVASIATYVREQRGEPAVRS